MVLNELRRLLQPKYQQNAIDSARHFDNDHYMQLAHRPLSDDGKKAREKLFNEIASDEKLFHAFQKELRLKEQEKRQLLCTNASVVIAVNNQDMLNRLGRMVLKRRASVNEKKIQEQLAKKESIAEVALSQTSVEPPSLKVCWPRRRRSLQILDKVVGVVGTQQVRLTTLEDDDSTRSQDEKRCDEVANDAYESQSIAAENTSAKRSGRFRFKRRVSVNEKQVKEQIKKTESNVEAELSQARAEPLPLRNCMLNHRRRSFEILDKVVGFETSKVCSLHSKDSDSIRSRGEKPCEEVAGDAVETQSETAEECSTKTEENQFSVCSSVSSKLSSPFSSRFPKLQLRRQYGRAAKSEPLDQENSRNQNHEKDFTHALKVEETAGDLDQQLDEVLQSNDDPWAREGFDI